MKKLILILAIVLLASLQAFTATTKWINANGGAWETAANWDNGVPTTLNNAVIDAASFAANGKVITIGALAQCAGLDMSLSDQTFTI